MKAIVAGMLVGLTLLVPPGARASECLDGDYVVVGEPLLASSAGGAFGDVVRIDGGTVAIASGCAPVRARIRRTAHGTIVRAAWRSCGTLARRVRLRAVVNKPCRALRGLFVTRRPPALRRFTALREQPACDDATVPCPCGGFAGIPCPSGFFCDLDGGCRIVDAQGECVPVPEACPDVYQPVCGCDGVTYGNDCERQAARAQKAHDGACATERECKEPCDCYRARTFPEPCPLDCATCDNYWTCDDGTCVAHCGPVPQPPPVCEPVVCGGIAGVGCPKGLFCELPKGECSTADLQGACLPVPEVCPELYAPVCGCDGVTYSSDCDRQQAGVQYGHDGPCGAPCDSVCDCAKDPLPAWCSVLLCPAACGCVWTCDGGRCAVEVRTPPPDPSVCAGAR